MKLKTARRLQELSAGWLLAMVALAVAGIGNGVMFLVCWLLAAAAMCRTSAIVSRLKLDAALGPPAEKAWPKMPPLSRRAGDRVGKLGGERVVLADGRRSMTAISSMERHLFERVFHCFRHDHLVLLGEDRRCPVCGGDDSGSMWRTPETHRYELDQKLTGGGSTWGGGGGGGEYATWNAAAAALIAKVRANRGKIIILPEGAKYIPLEPGEPPGEPPYAIGRGLPSTLVHRALELCWQATHCTLDPYTAWRRCAVVLDSMEAYRAEPGYPDLAGRVRTVRDQVEPDAQAMAARRDMVEVRTIGDPPGWGPWVPGHLRD